MKPPPKPANDDPRARLLAEARAGRPLRKAWIYTRLSGPGWLQGAITLGGGSLAGSLYLGILFGTHLLWLQPLAMLCGVIMLSAIAYVTVSTGRRAFRTVNEDVSPVLGWAWLVATLVANVVLILPQFALGVAAIQQNLLPSLAGPDKRFAIGAALLVAAAVTVAGYDRGGAGVRWFERVLKGMVALIVLSFLGVVAVLFARGALDLGAILRGLVPDPRTVFEPTPAFAAAIAETPHPGLWREIVIADQRDKIMTAFGITIGINMTFLLPASILRRGWTRPARGLAIFDLVLGMMLPFVVATGCLVVAAASQFHGRSDDVLRPDGTVVAAMRPAFEKQLARLEERLPAGGGPAAEVTAADRRVAAMLANRDTAQLAAALDPLTGPLLAHKVFGIGVLGMALSTALILMLINGFAVCEAFDRPDDRRLHLAGALLPGLVGVFAPVLWTGDAKAALAVPTAVLGSALLPIAYFTFFLLMNSRRTLGSEMPAGARRLRWNLLMVAATSIATAGSVWVLLSKGAAGRLGILLLVLLLILGLAGFLRRGRVIR